VILAPWDARGWAWDISSDLENIADARNFANCLIKDSNDPMWGNAARAILTAIVVSLMKEKQSWELKDILAEAGKGYAHIRGLVMQYCPESTLLVESEEITRTTQGFMTNLAAYLSTVADLAAAWAGKKEENKAIPFKKWLLMDIPDNKKHLKTIIMQGNARYLPLQQAYMQAIMSILGATISSPALTNSRNRRVWFVLDEVAQIGKIDTLTTTLAVGRSKGIRMILGAQDLSQIKEIYGDNVADAWATNISTWILGKTSSVETARYFSEFVGKRKIRKYMPVFSGGGMAGSTADQRQDSWQETEEWVIRPEEWAQLGSRPQKKAVELVLITGGPHAYRLLWPWQSAEKLRPEEVSADWTRRSYADLASSWAAADAAPEHQQGQGDSAAGPPQIEQRSPAALEISSLTAVAAAAPQIEQHRVPEIEGLAHAAEVAATATETEALDGIAEILEITTQIGRVAEIVDAVTASPPPGKVSVLASFGGRRPATEEEKEC